MDLEIVKERFIRYVNNFDTNDSAISRKLYHSLRVMDLCMLLAKYNNFKTSDMEIAMLTGLLHDYARFEQWTKYKTFVDSKSIDHGDLACELLFRNNDIKNFSLNEKYYDEIYDAIKYHNKYSIPDYLTDHNKLLCKVVRDADKLDILYLLSINKSLLLEDDKMVSEKVREDFFNNKSIKYSDVKSCSDKIILSLAMIFDLNFKYSYEYLSKRKLVDKIFDSVINKNIFKEYFEYIKYYIEGRI